MSGFFEEKLGIKTCKIFILILLAKCIKPEVMKSLFDQRFKWIPAAETLFEQYREYVGANVIKKLIWTARFAVRSSKRRDLENMKFFRMSGDLFL